MKKYLQDINRDDCLSFMRHLYSSGNEARTVFNRMGIVEQLLRLHGITGLLKRRDKPKYVANVREMYQPEDLQALGRVTSAIFFRNPDGKVNTQEPDGSRLDADLHVYALGLRR